MIIMATKNVSAGPGHQFFDGVSNTPETTIQIGDSVQWTAPTQEHTIVSDNVNPFNSLVPPLDGDVDVGTPPYVVQFSNAGTYGYHCSIHGGDPVTRTGMYGIIRVQPPKNSGAFRSAAAGAQPDGGGVLPPGGVQTTGWYAWNNRMPPGPPSFHIIGEITVPNPGVDVLLTERVPQGINPQIILLALHLVQRPGLWPQHVAVKQAHFEKYRAAYSEADVFFGTSSIAHLKVVDVS
jgi:plastocyanin